MKRFFVTGLPRSRTAWMANYLTYGKTYCHHDGFVGLSDPREYVDLIYYSHFRHGYEKIGNSDPANLFFLRTLIELCPEAEWVLIKRDPEEARISSEKAFKQPCDLSYFIEQMNTLESLILADKVKGIIIEFDKLDGAIRDGKFEHITSVPNARKEMLLTMDVKLTEERLSRCDLANPELMNHIDKNECILA